MMNEMMNEMIHKDMEWTTNGIFSFINDLEGLPVLWDSRIPQHRMSKRKSDIWFQLATKYKCTPDELKRKWQSLQAAFRREKMREISSGGTYKSRWFAYNCMAFVGDRYKPRKSVNSSEELYHFQSKVEPINEDVKNLLAIEDEPTAEEEQEHEGYVEEPGDIEMEATQQDMECTSESKSFLVHKPIRFKKVKLQYHDGSNRNGTFSVVKQTAVPDQEERNECTIFGEYVAKKLNKLDDRLCALVQHEIHNILFQAEMGLLADYSLAAQSSFATSDLSPSLHSPSSTTHNTNVYEVHRTS